MIKDSIYLKSLLPTTGVAKSIEYVRKNRVLMYQGQRGDAVYYILFGALGLTAAARAKERIISLLGPRSFAGTECIASIHAKNQWSCHTLTDSTLLRIDRDEMLRMIQTQETFAILFLDYLRDRITRYQDIIVNRAVDSSEMRLVRTLLMLTNCGSESDPLVIVPGISHSILAEVVNTTASRVTFLMNRLRHLGLIAYRKQSPISIHVSELSEWLKDESQTSPKPKAQIIQWPERIHKLVRVK